MPEADILRMIGARLAERSAGQRELEPSLSASIAAALQTASSVTPPHSGLAIKIGWPDDSCHIEARADDDNAFVIISMANAGYADYAANLTESVRRAGCNSLLTVFGIGHGAEDALQSRGVPVRAAPETAAQVSRSSGALLSYGAEGFFDLVLQKVCELLMVFSQQPVS